MREERLRQYKEVAIGTVGEFEALRSRVARDGAQYRRQFRDAPGHPASLGR